MKYRVRIAKIPDGGVPIAGQSVTARQVDTGEALGSAVSDSNGIVTFQTNGHWPPFYLHVANVPGGDKFWRSDESHTTGPLSPKELPFVLRALGDGVIASYAGLLEVSLANGGPTVGVAPGAAVVAGHPAVFYDFVFLQNTRPQSGTRTDHVVIRLFPEGSADPRVGQSALAITSYPLIQTSNIYDLPLATLIVPSSGAISITDDRNISASSGSVVGTSSLASASTTSGSGEFFSAMNFTLDLPTDVTYDVNVWASVNQDVTGGFVDKASFGSFGSGTSPVQFNNPGQIAVDGSGNVYVADRGNNRVVMMSSAGTVVRTYDGLPGVSGVCVDTSSNVYVVGTEPNVTYNGGVFGAYTHKYDASGFLVWSNSWQSFTESLAAPGTQHCATDGSTMGWAAYYPDYSIHAVFGTDCATGTENLGFSDDFTHPVGIVWSGGAYWTVDQGRNIVQSPLGNISIAGGAEGVARNTDGDLFVTLPSSGAVYRYTSGGSLIGSLAVGAATGVATSGNTIVWAASANYHHLQKFVLEGFGHGGIAVAINGAPTTYTNLDIAGTMQSSMTTTVAGPTSLLIQLAGKSNFDTTTLRNLVLSARAVPRA